MNVPSCTRASAGRAALYLGMALVLAAVYHQAVSFSFVNWDDTLYVLDNPFVRSPSFAALPDALFTPYLGYPAPVTILTYVLERSVFGLDPAAFHATNLFLHAATVLLVLACALRLGASTPRAVLLSLLFGIHPATAEPVSWVAGRKEVLAALFALWALYSYLRAGRLDWRVSLLLVLSMLSKPNTALLPAGFLWLWHSRRPHPHYTVSRLVPSLFAMGVAVFVVWFSYSHEAAVGALQGQGPWWRRICLAAYVHAKVLLYPFHLLPRYIYPPSGPPWWHLVLGAGVMVLALGILVLAHIVDFLRPALPGILLAALAYLPTSGIFPLSREFADSYVYLPLAGLVLACAPIRIGLHRFTRDLMRAVAASMALLLAGVSYVHARTYRDGVTLWSVMYRAYPDSPQVCRNLGNAYLFDVERGDLAPVHYAPAKAAAVYTHCIRTLGHRDFFLKNLAIATFRSGRLSEARRLFLEYLAKHPGDLVAKRYLRTIASAGGTTDGQEEP